MESKATQTNWCVYMHENRVNGKKYIGITSQKPTRRWQNGAGYVNSQRFFNAIKKYGWDAFRHELLFTELTQEEAERLEIELIAKYGTQDREKGYNIAEGGATPQHAESTRQLISEALKGKPKSEEHRRKDSESHMGVKNNRYGTKHSPETIKKMSESAKGRTFSETTRRKMSAAAKARYRKAVGIE